MTSGAHARDAVSWRWEGDSPELVPAGLRAEFAPATRLLYEWRSYWVRAEGAEVLRVGGLRVRPELPGLFRVCLRNQLGLTEIVPERGGVAVGEPCVAEVLSPKFPTPAAHREFLAGLLSALARDARMLPFARDPEVTTRWRTERVEDLGPDVVEALELLLRLGPSILGAMSSLRARPDERSLRGSEYVPAGRATFVEPDGVVAALTDPRAFPGYAARRTGRWVPGRVRLTHASTSTNTEANRAASLLVRVLRALSASLLAHARLTRAQRAMLGDLCGSCTRALACDPLQGHSNEAMPAELPRFPAGSLRFDGYRTLALVRDELEASQLAVARSPIDRARAARDVATLYEHWAFFALARAIEGATGIAPTPAREGTLDPRYGARHGATLAFGGAGALHYNPRVRSYSGPQKPDFLWCRGGRAELALDAKFRLEFDEFEQARAKREDVDRMHAYRDALGVRAAVCIYPGDRSVFHSAEQSARGPRGVEELFSKGAGVGAFAMHPSRGGHGP